MVADAFEKMLYYKVSMAMGTSVSRKSTAISLVTA
jgi:hypothetical protein